MRATRSARLGSRTVLVAFVLWLSWGCGLVRVWDRDSLLPDTSERTFISAPDGATFGSPAWISANRLIANYQPARSDTSAIYSVSLNGAMEPVTLPDEAECLRTDHFNPTVLADGRVAFIESCRAPIARVPLEANRLMVYDPLQGTTQALRPYFFHANYGLYALSPDAKTGLIADRGSSDRGLLALDASRLERLRTTTRWPGIIAWSPTEEVVAAAADDGAVRTHSDLVLLSPRGDLVRTLLAGLSEVRGLS